MWTWTTSASSSATAPGHNRQSLNYDGDGKDGKGGRESYWRPDPFFLPLFHFPLFPSLPI